MKKFFRCIIVISALLGNVITSSSAYAAEGSQPFLIRSLSTQWDSKTIHFLPVLPHTMPNPGGCQYWDYAIEGTAVNQKELFAIAMSAFVNQKRVSVIVEGCTTDQRVKVIAIGMS